MQNPNAASMFAIAPLNGADKLAAGPLPAAPGAAQKFQMLMFGPSSANGMAMSPSHNSAVGNGLRGYLEGLSRRWDAGQSSLKVLVNSSELSTTELLATQMQMMNCAVDMEISSKCASTFENGVQTLVQRGG